MKVLLLMPPTDLKKSYGELRSFSNPRPSIGIAYISAILKENGYDVKVVDAYVNGYNIVELMNIIGEYVPDIVGISVLSTSAETVYEISRNIRVKYPKAKIVMGNLHASLFSSEILSEDYADFIVHREGEFAMLELLEAFKNNGRLEAVKGISFKVKGTIVDTSPRPYIENLDQISFPSWHLFPNDKYSTDPRTEVKRGIVETQILATRGCPNQCTFCSSWTKESSGGNKYRMREPNLIIDEMVYMNKTYGSEIFSFVDLAFPLIRKHAIHFCDEIIKRRLNKKFRWFTECRVKPIDKELLALIKKAGCVRVCFGIESGNDRILEQIKKNFTKEDVRAAIRMAQKAGLIADGMFMIGLPKETEETIKETIDFAIELNVRYAIFNIFVPYPGSEIYDKLKLENKIHFKCWGDFTSYPAYGKGTPVYVPDQLIHEKLIYLQKYAMRKFYLRPKFILNEFRRLKFSQIKNYYYGLKGLLS